MKWRVRRERSDQKIGYVYLALQTLPNPDHDFLVVVELIAKTFSIRTFASKAS